MKLLYISTFMFFKESGTTYGLPSCAAPFFEKYLDVFDSVRVLGENLKSYLSKSALVEIQDSRIQIEVLPSNTKPKDFKNDRYLKHKLTEEIGQADAILIKPASRRGMMAIRIAESLQKPYMIEMTGDIHNALMQSPSTFKRLYAPILYRKIRKAIKNCEFGLYVSKDYLQGKYPIKGKMCGCSDVVLEPSTADVIQRRIEKINALQAEQRINLALIGFYQGNGKGVDTALRALSRLPENYHLSVLGNGTAENRQKWYEYGKNIGVSEDRLHFPEPLPSTERVLHWLDDFDFFVFPTRSEGFGRVVAEAMSRGMPCFATDICTMPELLSGECLFPLDDDKRLAELLLEYTSNKKLLKETAHRNFEHVHNYDFEVLKKRRDAFLSEFKIYCGRKNEINQFSKKI